MTTDYLKNLDCIRHEIFTHLASGAKLASNHSLINLIDSLMIVLSDIEKKLHEKPKEKQETASDVAIWKQFPVRLCTFEKSHDFCLRMHFCPGRLTGLLRSKDEPLFRGTYNKVKSSTGEGFHYYIDPDKFLEALLRYPFRNPLEKMIVEQYLKERGQHEQKAQ